MVLMHHQQLSQNELKFPFDINFHNEDRLSAKFENDKMNSHDDAQSN